MALLVLKEGQPNPSNLHRILKIYKSFSSTSAVFPESSRSYGNVNTGRWMRRAEENVLGDHVDDCTIILPLVLSYDKTSLTNATGSSSRSVVPLYVGLATADYGIGSFPHDCVGCVGFFPELNVGEIIIAPF